MMYNYGGWGLGWGGGLLMALVGMAFIVLVIWAVIKITNHHPSTTNKTPIDIAKERYAKGEITKEQFEQIKKDLNQ